MKIELSFIIVSYNARQLLLDCLSSIFATVTTMQCEIIVIDNGSTNGSPQLIEKEFRAVILIKNKNNMGFAEAINQGIRIVRGRYILLLNSDALAMENTAEKLIQFLETHPEIVIVGLKILNPDKSIQSY